MMANEELNKNIKCMQNVYIFLCVWYNVSRGEKYMQVNEVFWADSSIEEINIKYDILIIKVFNDALNKLVNIVCKKFAGLTNLCLWDDTDILNVKLEKASDESFYNDILKAYTNKHGKLDNSNKDRTLESGLLKLTITLTNGILSEIYCQSVEII